MSTEPGIVIVPVQRRQNLGVVVVEPSSFRQKATFSLAVDACVFDDK